MKESLMFKIIPVFIGLVFVLILVSWAIVGTIAFKSADEIGKHGLKSVIERVWEGESRDHGGE